MVYKATSSYYDITHNNQRRKDTRNNKDQNLLALIHPHFTVKAMLIPSLCEPF